MCGFGWGGKREREGSQTDVLVHGYDDEDGEDDVEPEEDLVEIAAKWVN